MSAVESSVFTNTANVAGTGKAGTADQPNGTTLATAIGNGDGILNGFDVAKIDGQAANLPCSLQMDVVIPGKDVPTAECFKTCAIPELVRAVATEEKNGAIDGQSTLKSVYVRLEFQS